MSSRMGRPRLVRASTISLTRVSAEESARARVSLQLISHDRPRVRGDCEPGNGGAYTERPCPYVSCKFHLYLDVSEAGSVKLNFPDLDPLAMEETCALDVADQGGKTLEEVGALLNLTRERVRQIEEMSCDELEKHKGILTGEK